MKVNIKSEQLLGNCSLLLMKNLNCYCRNVKLLLNYVPALADLYIKTDGYKTQYKSQNKFFGCAENSKYFPTLTYVEYLE